MTAQKTKSRSENKKYTDFYKNKAIKCLKSYTSLENAELNIREQLVVIDKYINLNLDKYTNNGNSSYADDELAEESNLIKAGCTERDILNYRMTICIAKRRAIERSLEALPSDEKIVLKKFFIQPKHYNCAEDLMEMLGFEKTQIYRIRDKALRHFASNMFGCGI